MKKYYLTFLFLTFLFPYLSAQSNLPMATVITGNENQPAPVQKTEPSFLTPRLYWEGASRARIAQQVKTGERITLVLRAAGWKDQSPPSSFFMPEVPRDVILAAAPVSAEERFNGILIKFTLIAIKEGEFILPARTLQHENIIFNIPELKIKIISLL